VTDPQDNNGQVGRLFDIGNQVVVLRNVRGGGSRDLYPKGVVGIVVRLPCIDQTTYAIRFMDGSVEAFAGSELALLAKYRQPTEAQAQIHQEQSRFYDRIIYQCVIGSRASGLSHEDSDVDRRGIYLPSAQDHWSLFGVPEQLECESTQEAYWEYQKFLILALKANPNALECLYSPLVEKQEPAALPLLENRHIFLSQLVYQTFSGYVSSQFKKIQTDIRNQGQVKWKHAMHLIRLLICGTEILKNHHVAVDVGQHRQMLLEIRRGEIKWDQLDALRKAFQKEFDRAFSSTSLPERPDYARANELLIQARMEAMSH
jgi:predicted nucleotidyltransferase